MHAGEPFERFGDHLKRQVQFHAHRHRRQGVQHVVPARRDGVNFAQNPVLVDHLKPGVESAKGDVAGRVIGLTQQPVGDVSFLQARDERLDVGFVEAKYCGAVKRNAVNEFQKRFFQVIKGSVMVHVFFVERGDDGDGRREFQKGTVAFVRFRHQEFALPHFGVTADALEFAADHHGGVQLAAAQHRRDQGGGGGFAMGAGDGDAVFHAHQLRQHLGPRDDRDHFLPGGKHFDVVGFHRARGHHHLAVLHVVRFMLEVDAGSNLFQVRRRRGTVQVRTGDFVSLVDQYFSNAAHAGASNANEVNAFGLS